MAARALDVPLLARIATVLFGLAIAACAIVLHGRASVVSAPARPAPKPIVADDAGALREVLVHYVPELAPAFGDSYRDFLGTLPAQTSLVVVHPRGKRAALDAFVASIDPSGALAARMRPIEIDAPLGIWSKDRALVLADESGAKTTFLVPPRPRSGESSRPFDWDIVPAVVAAEPQRFDVRQLPFAFDAGDFAIAGKRIVFDVNVFTRNRTRGFASPLALGARMRSVIGRDVVLLGSEEGDVPRHHMSMYMAPVGDDTVLVGDPSAALPLVGADFAPGEASPETGEPLRADFSPETQARFDRAARDLARAGFRVVRIPTVAFDDKTYFAYTNGVYETRDGQRVAWMPSFGVPALDRAAEGVYASLGFHVNPVRVRKLYAQHGTIGCVVNVLAREK